MIYSPREDSYLLEKQVKKFAKGKSFLDMGSGSGIQAKAALSVKAKSVLAVDINPEVIYLLKYEGIPAIKSDLFAKMKKSRKFDIIAFNPPYLPENKREDIESALATTGGKKGDEVILRFLKQSKNHLNDGGMILLVVSSLTLRKRILSLLKKQKMNYKVLSKEKLFFEELEVWKISF